jgi:hypothetical protein
MGHRVRRKTQEGGLKPPLQRQENPGQQIAIGAAFIYWRTASEGGPYKRQENARIADLKIGHYETRTEDQRL